MRNWVERNPRIWVWLMLLVGLVHVAVIAPHYFVGSFDDDANYVLTAKAILAGQGLSGHTASGAVVAGSYAPGYSLLLVPLLWLAPGTFVPLRLLSVVCFAALFPLTWTYLGRRNVTDLVRGSALALLALSPVGATFAQMVMAEMPYLVVFMAMLLALDTWVGSSAVVCRSGLGVVAAAIALVWLKEAAAATVAGLVLWLVLERQLRKAAAVVVSVGLSLIPVAAARISTGTPLAGSRYSAELGTYYSGGLLSRVFHVAPEALHSMLSVALPATVVPRGVPLPEVGVGAHLLRDLAWVVTFLVIVGGVVWWRRHRDGALVVVLVYLGEALLWPFINERRVILVLPVILGWVAVGASAVAERTVALVGHRRIGAKWCHSALVIVAAGVFVAPLAAQFSRDYLYGDGQDSSRPQGSRYMRFLAGALPSDAIVETDYLSTVALFGGHRTAESAFLANLVGFTPSLARCASAQSNLRALREDGAGYLVTGSLNKPMTVDGPCLLEQASSSAWAVRLLRTAMDGVSVFELIGPGTVNPGLADLTGISRLIGSSQLSEWSLESQGLGDNPSSGDVIQSSTGQGSLTWDWGADRPIDQISVGYALSLDGPTAKVQVEIREATGRWVSLATIPGAVGDPPAAAPYILLHLAPGTRAEAMRLDISGPGRLAAADVHVLAPVDPPQA